MEWKYFPGTAIRKCTGHDSLETHTVVGFRCLGVCCRSPAFPLQVGKNRPTCDGFPLPVPSGVAGPFPSRCRSAKNTPPATLFRLRCPPVSRVPFPPVAGRRKIPHLRRYFAFGVLWCCRSGNKCGPATERPGGTATGSRGPGTVVGGCCCKERENYRCTEKRNV